MEIADFIRVLTTFADTPADLDIEKGHLIVQVREELIEAEVTQPSGALTITESGSLPVAAHQWLINRIARIPQLTDRILSYVTPTPNYVTPRGRVLEQLDASADDSQATVTDAGNCMRAILGRRPAGTSTVLYLTSDAGEGKTTLITEVARAQALGYKQRKTDWLLIPINLGGRPFMRFDDVVIGALVNRLRFPFFYYDAFIELVRMGVLVPAFDGFEEVFIEGGTGEALSALGSLVNTLRSSGSMLVSARKAYFEYRDFAQTARLFDAIGTDSVSFARISLSRWNEGEFVRYGQLRGVENARELYERTANRLGSSHPILTRAVLVRRLFDVATTLSSSDELIARLGGTSEDYFFEFINAIVEREAAEKWLDRSGEASESLITTTEHHELLSMVALEMWLGGTDLIRQDLLDVVAEVFAEHRGKAPIIARQVKERLRQHALLSTANSSGSSYAFDHEDFRRFFLGEAIGSALVASSSDLQAAIRKGALPAETCDSIAQLVKRRKQDVAPIAERLLDIAQRDHSTSFTRENCASIVVRLMDLASPADNGLALRSLTFATDALPGRSLNGVVFEECYFQSMSLANTQLDNCIFRRCRFETIELHSTTAIRQCWLDECEVSSVASADPEIRTFDPARKIEFLDRAGFIIVGKTRELTLPEFELDERTVLTERALRLFLRNTHVNESALRVRLGVRATEFIDGLLPILMRARILEDVPYRGAGHQRRFRLGVPMQKIEQTLRATSGDFDAFVRIMSRV